MSCFIVCYGSVIANGGGLTKGPSKEGGVVWSAYVSQQGLGVPLMNNIARRSLFVRWAPALRRG